MKSIRNLQYVFEKVPVLKENILVSIYIYCFLLSAFGEAILNEL